MFALINTREAGLIVFAPPRVAGRVGDDLGGHRTLNSPRFGTEISRLVGCDRSVQPHDRPWCFSPAGYERRRNTLVPAGDGPHPLIAIKRTGPRGSSRATRKTEGAALHRDLTPGQTVCSQLNPCLSHFVVGRQLVSRSLFHGVHGAEEGPSGFATVLDLLGGQL